MCVYSGYMFISGGYIISRHCGQAWVSGCVPVSISFMTHCIHTQMAKATDEGLFLVSALLTYFHPIQTCLLSCSFALCRCWGLGPRRIWVSNHESGWEHCISDTSNFVTNVCAHLFFTGFWVTCLLWWNKATYQCPNEDEVWACGLMRNIFFLICQSMVSCCGCTVSHTHLEVSICLPCVDVSKKHHYIFLFLKFHYF